MAKRTNIAEQLRRAVKAYMKANDASYFTLGAACGVNPAIINRFVTEDEDSRRDIRLETAAKLCEALGLSLTASG